MLKCRILAVAAGAYGSQSLAEPVAANAETAVAKDRPSARSVSEGVPSIGLSG